MSVDLKFGCISYQIRPNAFGAHIVVVLLVYHCLHLSSPVQHHPVVIHIVIDSLQLLIWGKQHFLVFLVSSKKIFL